MSEPPRRRSQSNGPRLQELYEDAQRRYSRRSIFRAGAAGGALLAAANLGTASASGFEAPAVLLKGDDAGAALRPFGRHLAFGADPTRQVVVSWQVPAGVRAPYLR